MEPTERLGFPARRAAIGFGVLVALAFSATAALAAPGELDASLSGDGKLTTSFTTGVDGGNAVALQADGKIVVVGGADLGSGFAVARYNPDGGLDATFDGETGSGNGKVLIPSDNDGDLVEALAVAIQPSDQKIVVAGYGFNDDPADGSEDFALARLNTDGTLDDSSDSTPGSNLGGDGTLLTQFATAPDDFSFNNDRAQAVAVQGDGDIVAAGFGDPTINDPDMDGEEDEHDFALARYDSNGALDNGFGGDGKVTTDVRAPDSYDIGQGLVLLPGNELVVVGFAQLNLGVSGDHSQGMALAQYESDGDLDASFGTSSHPGIRIRNFTGIADQLRAVVRQPDGALVATGSMRENLLVARFTATGADDNSFGGDGIAETVWSSGATDESWNSVALQPNGKIVTGGITDPFGVGADFIVGRFLATGEGDRSWNNCVGATRTDFGGSDAAQGIAIDASGRLVAAGYAGSDFALARYIGGEGVCTPPDRAPPNTTIQGPRRTRKRRPVYRLISTEPSSTFRCRINGRATNKPFTPCSSPFRMPRLPLGPTRFEAKAVDKSGNADPTAAFIKIKRIPRRRR